jgi:hypothetical protein
VQKRLEQKCDRCELDAVAGRRLCQSHLDARRKRDAAKKKRRRARRRDARRCIDCRRPTKKQRCPKCYGESRGVPRERGVSPPAEDSWRVDPGTTWMRFRGKGRRGRLTREEQIEEDKRDARFAIAEIEKFVHALDVVASPEVQALPMIQRAEARRLAGAFLGFAGRFLDDLADKYS